MDKDRKNPETEELTNRAQAEAQPLPAEEAFPDDDLGEELSPEELEAAPALYEEEEEPVELQAPVARKWDKKKKKRSGSRYRTLIWAASAVVMLAIVYVGVRILFPPEEVVEEQADADYAVLVDYANADIDALKFEYRDGYAYEVNMTRALAESGYTETTYTVVGKTEFEYSASAFSSMLSAVARVTSATVAVEDPEDLGVYGLDDPAVRVSYTVSEGEPTVLLVGDKAPVGTGYYGMLEGDNTVYVLGALNAETMLQTDLSYRELLIASYPVNDTESAALTETNVSSAIDSVQIVRPDGELFIRRQTEEERQAGGIFSAVFQIKEPVDTACNNVYLENRLLANLVTLSATAVVEDRPTDLTIYGLDESDEPIMLELVNLDGTTLRMYLGDTTEDGLIYARLKGDTSVYTFDASIFDFVDVKYNDLMDVALWVYMIEDVDSVEMELKGETHLLDFEDVTSDSLTGYLDGEEISEENARKLYTRVLQIYYYDVLKEDVEPGEIEYRITIHLNDGTDSTLEFAKVGERSYAVIRNGVDLGVYARVTDLNPIIEGIEDIKIGYTLDRLL